MSAVEVLSGMRLRNMVAGTFAYTVKLPEPKVCVVVAVAQVPVAFGAMGSVVL